METDSAKMPIKIPQPTASSLVAALFTETKSAHGALADLARAGVPGDQIGVAFSAEGQRALWSEFELGGEGHRIVPKDEYSLIWRLRRSFEHDLHKRGADQFSATGSEEMLNGADHPYYLVHLHDTLRAIGVAEDRILLLDRALGMRGVLVLVEAGDRVREVERILERNSGQIRSASATEREHLTGH
ncbi:MAG TPA: hypothetical protein VGR96_01000 [Acidobacteriaceae bacterium]|nr:hypothetical protein [Acidobacteriaceae bacterium]